MGKKTKKNRFNREIEVGIVYNSNTLSDIDPRDNAAELNLSREKVEELQKIRAQLPSLTTISAVDAEVAKVPTEKPFRAFVHNIAPSVSENDIAIFFEPLQVTNVNMPNTDGNSRGFCFVDFETRDDLIKALERHDSMLAGRPISVRVASPNPNERSGGYGDRRERYGQGGGRRGPDAFNRNRSGGYKPGVLRDEIDQAESSTDDWSRGFVASRVPTGGPSGFQRSQQSYAPPQRHPAGELTGERPRLRLAPRTAPLPGDGADGRNSKIFGGAKPVDTASKDRELEERLSATRITPTNLNSQ